MNNNATDLTLQYYAEKAKDFAKDTQAVNFSDIQQEFLKFIPSKGLILDLGCGAGRDSKAFLDAGYNVIAMDGSPELCEITSKYIKQKVICSTFQDFQSNIQFDGIWACASLLHLPLAELRKVIPKLIGMLKKEGCFYLSFKYGNFSGIRNGRFFTDMTEKTFNSLIAPIKNIRIKNFSITSDIRPNRENEKWLNIYLLKN